VTAVAPVKPPPPTWGKLGVGFGLDWGFFLTPDGPNEYIRDWMHEQADIIIRETGTEQMLLNFVPKLAVGWSPVSLLRLQAVSELGWGPKIVTLTVTGGDTNSRVFQFIRLSEGLLANIEVPVGATGNTRLTAGGGGLIHYLRFEEWRDTTFGFRVQAGVAIQSRGPRLDVLVMFDRARTLVPRPGAPPFALDYSSLLAGGMVTFDLIR
jgi:hypothetical protein